MSNLLLGSLGHCLTHHSIIGDMTFLYCTDMGWSSFIPPSYCLFLCVITSIHIFVPLFIHFLHIDTRFWFDTFFISFTCFTDGLITYPFSYSAIDISLGYLGSMAHEFFYTCRILYTKAWVFYYWVFGPSFSSFLLPHLPSLRTSRVLSPP